jgi:hypothetical protein
MNQRKNAPQSGISDKRAAVEQELRLAKEYWQRTIQPHIEGRKLRGVELFVAQAAYHFLQSAQRKAEIWNRSEEGRGSPLENNLPGESFYEPEVLYADENLKPEILATIAAPLMYQGEASQTSTEAVRTAHELLMAAERYIGTLPKKTEGTESLVADFDTAFSTVTLAEIEASNKKTSGQIPLLPPVQQKRNEGILTVTAIKNAAKRFLEQKKKNHPQISEAQWNREAKEVAKLAQQGFIPYPKHGTGKLTTYQHEQGKPDEVIADCLQNNRIILQDLCDLRLERFKNFWQKQQRRVLSRKAPKKTFPKSASKRRH